MTITASDDSPGPLETWYSVDGSAYVLGRQALVPATGDASPDGVRTVRYYSVDLAGNVEPPKTALVRIDDKAPISTTAGVDDLWHRQRVVLDFSSTDRWELPTLPADR